MKKITFIPSSEEIENLVPFPKPAKLYVPEIYKKIKNDTLKNPKFEGHVVKNNIKQCMPFFDSLTNGYIQETWTDIYIKNEGDYCRFIWSSDPKIMSNREYKNKDIDNIFHQIEFVWSQPWKIKIEKGYSCLVVHPLNRDDLPFFTLSGIIDSDKYYHANFGNIPFYLKKDFEGLIPSGTPMYQIIPIKRDNWKTEILKFDEKQQKILSYQIQKKFWGAYKNNFWIKKNFT